MLQPFQCATGFSLDPGAARRFFGGMARAAIRIGTRGSRLALWQAHHIRDILQRDHGCEVEIITIKTVGDRIDDVALSQIEGKGFFTKEIEQALLDNRIDLAVHSLKDLMTVQPEGLKMAAVGFRADRRELLLIRREVREGAGFIPVRQGAVIGAGSARRKAQVAHHNRALNIKDLRGNVPTRVQKLRDGLYDAIVIAAAGVERLDLDLSGLEAIHLDPERFLPAPGQGVLALQTRGNDTSVNEIVGKLNDETASIEVALERGLLARFKSGCSLPLGVFSEVREDGYRLLAVLGEIGNEESGRLRRIDVTAEDIDQVVLLAYTGLTLGAGSPQ